jgi:hypothetical protein
VLPVMEWSSLEFICQINLNYLIPDKAVKMQHAEFSVVMLNIKFLYNVIMVSVIILSVIMPRAIMLNVLFLSVIKTLLIIYCLHGEFYISLLLY